MRRVHVSRIVPGLLPIDEAQAHHARDVLRLGPGDEVELFDDDGATAIATLVFNGQSLCAKVDRVTPAPVERLLVTVAAAVPKGDRADWMVEKLSELGVATFIPLAAARSVVLPEGQGKRQRWERIATESAKQSRRAGVMRIEPLTRVDSLLAGDKPDATARWCLATELPGVPITQAANQLSNYRELTAFIGPEGGWAPDELRKFAAASLAIIKLGSTILRVETASIAVASVIACSLSSTSTAR